MTRTQAKEKINNIFGRYADTEYAADCVADDILLALDGTLVLETEVGQFSGIAHVVSRAE